jgi:hypothetical protein
VHSAARDEIESVKMLWVFYIEPYPSTWNNIASLFAAEAPRRAAFVCIQVGVRYDRPGRHRMNVACSE